MSSDLRGIFDFFIFWGKGERGKGFWGGECKLGILGETGDKSGIWRFYRRVWKNIFYEGGDKERKRGFWEIGRGNFVFFKIFLNGWRIIRNFMGKCIFGSGWGVVDYTRWNGVGKFLG